MTSRRHDVTTPRVLSLVNTKGGVGKTTTAVNLAAAWAERGARVLVVDLDGQCSAGDWLGASDDGGDRLLAVFVDGAAFHVSTSTVTGADVVASCGRMSRVDVSVSALDAVARLRDAVAAVRDRYAWTVFDCPGTLGTATVAALAASTDVVVPVEPGPLALAQLAGVLATVDRVRDTVAPGLGAARIVPVRVDWRTNLARTVVDKLRDTYGDSVTTTVVRESVRVRECPAARVSILEYDAAGSGAADYRALAVELDGGTP